MLLTFKLHMCYNCQKISIVRCWQLIDKETIEMIIGKYYTDVYKFCFNRLHNIHAAEECTQDVFLLLFQKRTKLNFTEHLRSWIYESATRICNKYLSKNSNVTVNIDDYADTIPDTKAEKLILKDIYEALNKEEADLFLRYIEADYGQRNKIADQMDISMKALYRRVDRIREKVIKYISE